jgi:hypothetical protein
MGHPVAQLVEALRHKPEKCGFDYRWYHRNFSFRPHYGPGIESASNRKDYQKYFMGVKLPVLTTLPPCLEIWEIKLLEPSGSDQTCNGTASPFFCIIKHQPLHISGLNGPPSGSTRLHKTVNFNQLSTFIGLDCNNCTSRSWIIRNENKRGETNVMKISRQPSPLERNKLKQSHYRPS